MDKRETDENVSNEKKETREKSSKNLDRHNDVSGDVNSRPLRAFGY